MNAETVWNGELCKRFQQREQRPAPPLGPPMVDPPAGHTGTSRVLAVVAFDEWRPIAELTRRCRLDQRHVSMLLLRAYRKGQLLRRGTRKSYEYRRVI